MAAVIRISGKRHELEQLVAASGLAFVESLVVVRARRIDPSADNGHTTYNLTISDAGGDAVPRQIEESVNYLRENGQVLAGIRNAVNCSQCSLDFSWDFPTGSMGQYNLFPIELIALLSDYRFTLTVSVYSASSDRAIHSREPNGELADCEVEDQASPTDDF